MFGFLKKSEPKAAAAAAPEGDATTTSNTPATPYAFATDGYAFPSLYEEADEMTIVALLMYTMTELRALARKEKVSNEILKLPITLEKTLELIHDNLETIKAENVDHDMTLTALKSIQDRFAKHKTMSSSGHFTNSTEWWNPFATAREQHDDIEPALLVAYGDERADQELVYAVGVDPLRKRVTVAFRGSVTPADFFTDACIELHRRPNPVLELNDNDVADDTKSASANKDDPSKTIGIHHGFDEYLLKRRKAGAGEKTKYDEILEHVTALFAKDNRLKEYKLYVTGHSLGGALACLFAFEVAAAAGKDVQVPLPVTCVSVASPRVGDAAFQEAFSTLEKAGRLRHLRIAHSQDPVTMMPKTSSRRILAALSPIVFVTLAVSDALFTSRETYRHTGVKLRLHSGSTKEKVYELSYQGVTTVEEETADNDDSLAAESHKKAGFFQGLKGRTWSFSGVPGVSFHFGPTYIEQLGKCKAELSAMSLNQIYARMASKG